MSLDKKLGQGEKAVYRTQKQIERELLKAYQASLKEIRLQIAIAYEKHGTGGKLTMAEMSKYNRLTTLEQEIGREVAKLTNKSAKTLTQGIGSVFAESHYRTAYALETTVGAHLGFGMLNPKTIEAAINNPLDRVGFIQRNKDNQALLARQLREQIAQGLIQGKSYQDTAKAIKARMDTGAARMLNIASTEMHRAQTEGRLAGLDTAEEAGVEMARIWSAAIDGKTRDMHADMDGRHADEDGIFTLPDGTQAEGPGLTGVPEHDCRCRCGVRAEIKGYGPKLRRVRLAEDDFQAAKEVEAALAAKEGRKALPVSRSEVVQYQNYHEWYQGRIGR